MPGKILTTVIDPTLALLAQEGIPASDKARAMLVAIGLQESRLKERRQLVGKPPRPVGPAMGLWQFEQGGGVKGVLTHKASRAIAEKYALLRVGSIELKKVWEALECDDVLACIFARLLLWTDPKAIPDARPENEEAAWQVYLGNWRPGKPHRQTWSGYWQAAIKAVEAVREPVRFDVEVTRANDCTLWVAECDGLKLRTEAESFEALRARVWEIAPEMVQEKGLSIAPDALRLRFSFEDCYPAR